MEARIKMPKLRTLIDGSIVSLFAAWLVSTLLSQHPENSLNRCRRLDNFAGNTIIPNWRFFAPNPAVEDVHVLYRFASQDFSRHSEWKECHTISPRRLWQAFWFPKRRFEKGVFDAHQSIMLGLSALGRSETEDAIQRKAIADVVAMLNNYVRTIDRGGDEWCWQQLLLVRFAGHDETAKPAYDVVLNYYLIDEGNDLQVDPGFECDEYFRTCYDEIMGKIDPDVQHKEWLIRTLNGRDPIRILDVGAGSGRVLKQIGDQYPSAELYAVEPDDTIRQQFEVDRATVFPKRIRDCSAERLVFDVDFVYGTYGPLQYVATREELLDQLKAIRSVMAADGLLAMELFSSEVYLNSIQPTSFTLDIQGEEHSIEFSTVCYANGLVLASTIARRHSDGTTGTMREIFLPVTHDEAVALMEDAGFSDVQVETRGAFHRCVAYNR